MEKTKGQYFHCTVLGIRDLLPLKKLLENHVGLIRPLSSSILGIYWTSNRGI